LLLPLQTVLKVENPKCLDLLEAYAQALDANETETVSTGVRLLAACQEVIASRGNSNGFIQTSTLLGALHARDWEGWGHYSSGQPLTAHTLARLLSGFGIKVARTRTRKGQGPKRRGYIVHDFEQAWQRYLPPYTPPPEAAQAAQAARNLADNLGGTK
jgi:hypothetical protein